MRQLALTVTLLAALLLGAAPAHAATSGVKVVGCESALDPAARVASFEGRMRVKHARGACRCASTLQERSPTARPGTSCRPRLRQVARPATRDRR